MVLSPPRPQALQTLGKGGKCLKNNKETNLKIELTATTELLRST